MRSSSRLRRRARTPNRWRRTVSTRRRKAPRRSWPPRWGLADSERGDALKAGLRAADVEASQIVAVPRPTRAIDEMGRERLPALVDEVVARVLEAPVMGAGWVAGSVRARLLLQHRVGAETARPSPRPGRSRAPGASLRLRRPSRTRAATSLERAQRDVAALLALRIRLLAAWLPRDAAGGLRALASWFELVNIEDRLANFGGAELRAPYELGMLSSVWAAAAATQSMDELRRLLAGSSWGDPGSDDAGGHPPRAPPRLGAQGRGPGAGGAPLGRRRRGAPPRRRSCSSPGGRSTTTSCAASGSAGRGPQAGSLADLRELLPRVAAWALDGIDDLADLWRAELAWWRRVAADAERMTRGRLDGGDVVLGAVALLAYDAMLLTVALAVAARGGSAPRRRSSMPSADLVLPKRMSRVAVVAPRPGCGMRSSRSRRAARVELVGSLPPPEGEEVEALRRLHRAGTTELEPALLDRRPDIAALERAGESGLLQGEVELGRHARLAVPHGSFAPGSAGLRPTRSAP